jgi:hypothetical protein
MNAQKQWLKQTVDHYIAFSEIRITMIYAGNAEIGLKF